MLIDPQGLLYGERIGACTDEAQLHFPRLLTASNRFGRIELGYPSLIKAVYQALRVKPTPEELRSILLEYRNNHLLFIYKDAHGKTYGQWEIPEKFLTDYKRAEDYNIPEPPADALQAFRHTYIEAKRAQSIVLGDLFDTLEVSESVPKTSKHSSTVGVGVGRGVGVGVGEGKDSCGAASAPPAIIGLPLISGDMHLVTRDDLARWTESYPAVDVMQHLRQMREWLHANPRNRKTSSGILKFVTNWLAKEQNAARTAPKPIEVKPRTPTASETTARHQREISEREQAMQEWRDLRQRDGVAFDAEAPGWVKAALAGEPAERVA